MNASELLYKIDEISQELDMLVYQLELPSESAGENWQQERQALRKRLEQLRDRLENVANDMA